MSTLYSLNATGIASLGDLAKVQGHGSLIPTLLRVNISFISITVCMVCLRLFVRLILVRHFGLDDLILAIGALFSIGFSSILLYGGLRIDRIMNCMMFIPVSFQVIMTRWVVMLLSFCFLLFKLAYETDPELASKYGLGRHIWDLNTTTIMPNLINLIKISFVGWILYATAISLTKISIIVTYFRIFPNKKFRIIMWVTLFVVIATWICSVFITIFQCRPVAAAWDFSIKDRKCIIFVNYSYASAAVNVATDLILCTVPLPLFWRLNLVLRERLIICVLFAFGFFAAVAAIMRLTQLHTMNSLDLSYQLISACDWSVVEIGTGILCASAPSTKPLISRLWPDRFRRTRQMKKIPGHTSDCSNGEGRGEIPLQLQPIPNFSNDLEFQHKTAQLVVRDSQGDDEMKDSRPF